MTPPSVLKALDEGLFAYPIDESFPETEQPWSWGGPINATVFALLRSDFEAAAHRMKKLQTVQVISQRNPCFQTKASRMKNRPKPTVPTILMIAALIAHAVFSVLNASESPAQETSRDTPGQRRFKDPSGQAKKIPWRKFSSARLKELRGKNIPVLVFCRADWDATCALLDRTLFADKHVINAIKKQVYVPLLADFTHPSDEIEGFLRDVGARPGEATIVVFHGPEDEAPIVLQMRNANKFISTEDLLDAIKLKEKAKD